MADLVSGVAESTRGVLAIEQRRGFLEGKTPRLDDEEVAEDELEGDPAAVHNVVLPAELLERDGVDILVEDEGEGDGEVEDVETLGTEAVRKDLDGVGDDERSERKAVI